MRVDAYNQITQVYQTNKTKKVASKDKANSSDVFELSQTGKGLQVAQQAVKAAPDVREDKVKQYKEQLASGTYNVSAEDFAEKMVNNYFNTII
jgi:negative regulator of flagellin synthesis FlgM